MLLRTNQPKKKIRTNISFPHSVLLLLLFLVKRLRSKDCTINVQAESVLPIPQLLTHFLCAKLQSTSLNTLSVNAQNVTFSARFDTWLDKSLDANKFHRDLGSMQRDLFFQECCTCNLAGSTNVRRSGCARSKKAIRSKSTRMPCEGGVDVEASSLPLFAE